MMTKSDTITEIMTLNPTVGAVFLVDFSNEDLLHYLQRLRGLSSMNATAVGRRDNDRLRPSPFATTTAAAV
ncbi:MAG: hypothetical protein AAB341_00990 [Planctomycetota bacterium]